MSTAPGPGSPSPPSPGRRGQGAVAVGLLLTFIALASIALGLPSDVAVSGGGFAFLTLGAVGLFLGGSLLGFAAGVRRPRRR